MRKGKTIDASLSKVSTNLVEFSQSVRALLPNNVVQKLLLLLLLKKVQQQKKMMMK